MRLNKKQKEHLLALVAEGLQSDEINARAAKFTPPFEVARQQVDFYRASRGVALEEIKAESESDALRAGFAVKERRGRGGRRKHARRPPRPPALRAGFAVKERRVEVLSEIAERIYADLQGGIREGDAFAFKEAEVKQLRGLFDDLAKESGARNYKSAADTGEQSREVKVTIAYERPQKHDDD